jgi:hypothetical protein
MSFIDSAPSAFVRTTIVNETRSDSAPSAFVRTTVATEVIVYSDSAPSAFVRTTIVNETRTDSAPSAFVRTTVVLERLPALFLVDELDELVEMELFLASELGG